MKFYKTLYFFIAFLSSYPSSTFGQSISVDWVKHIGGANDDNGNSICKDLNGNLFITGGFNDTVDFDPGPGVFNLISFGVSNIFICKYSPSGSLIWARSMESSGFDEGLSITVDGGGNVYTTGQFYGSTDFDPGPSITTLSTNGNFDIFFCKLDSLGNFVWAKSIGSSEPDHGQTIRIDKSNNVFLAGNFNETADFDPGVGIHNLSTLSPYIGSFIAKFDKDGNYIWAKSIETSYINSMILDTNSNIFTVGSFQGTTDFDPSSGIHNETSLGFYDGYICRFDSSGTLIFVKVINGYNDETVESIALDKFSNIFTSGSYRDSVDIDPSGNIDYLHSNGAKDIFITKLNNLGNLIWSKSIGGVKDDKTKEVIVDTLGAIYVVGTFKDTVDFDPSSSSSLMLNAHYYLGNDIFILKLDTLGNYLTAGNIGGLGNIYPGNIIFNDNNSILMTGSFAANSCDFDPNSGISTLTSNQSDIYLIKFFTSNNVGFEILEESKIKIYPNPTNSILTIQMSDLKETEINLCNQFGQSIIKENRSGKENYHIDLYGLPNGIYYLKVSNQKGVFNFKILKI